MKALDSTANNTELGALEDHSFAQLSVMQKSDISSCENIAIAVSGGPDSMALCALLFVWAKDKDITVHAITVDHGLRKEAAYEAKQVGKWLSSYKNIKHVIITRDAKNKGVTRIQEQARTDRYKLMAEYCADNSISHMFLAHHANDQAETVLFRIAKGSGIDGISAMKDMTEYNDKLSLVRPLLGFEKDDLISYCQKNKIEFVNDPSNTNDDFARVRLREASAVLEAEGLSVKRLNKLGQRMGRASKALDFYAKTAFETIKCENSELGQSLSLEYSEFIAMPEEIRVRVMKLAMRYLCEKTYLGSHGYGPRTEKLEDLVYDLSDNDDYADRTLAGFIIRRVLKNDRIIIEKEY